MVAIPLGLLGPSVPNLVVMGATVVVVLVPILLQVLEERIVRD